MHRPELRNPTTRLELADSILAARVEEDMTAEQGAAAQILADAVLAGATSDQLAELKGIESVTSLLVYAQMCMATREWNREGITVA